MTGRSILRAGDDDAGRDAVGDRASATALGAAATRRAAGTSGGRGRASGRRRRSSASARGDGIGSAARRVASAGRPAISDTPVAVRTPAGGGRGARCRGYSRDRHPSSEPAGPPPARSYWYPPGAWDPGSRSSPACWPASLVAAGAARRRSSSSGPIPIGRRADAVRRRRRLGPRRRASAAPSPPTSPSAVAGSASPAPSGASGGRRALPRRRARAAARRAPGRWRRRSTWRSLKGKPVWINFMQTTCPRVHRRVPADERLRGPLRGRRASSSSRSTSARTRRRSRRSPSGLERDVPARPRHRRRGPAAPGARSPCRSTSGSTRTGSSGTARSAASAPTSWPAALAKILPGVEVTP